MSRKRWVCFAVGLLVTLALLVPSCAKEEVAGIIKVGLAFSTTGAAQKTARGVRDGVLLAVHVYNRDNGGITIDGEKYTIVPIEYSTALKPEEGLAVSMRLIEEDNVLVMFGDCVSSVCLVQQPYIEEQKVPWVMFGAHPDLLGPDIHYSWRCNGTAELSAEGEMAWIMEHRGVHTWAILAETEEYAQSSMSLNSEAVEAAGGEVLLTDSFAPGCTDFYGVLTRMKALNPDAVYVITHDDTPTVLLQAHELGFEPKLWKVHNAVNMAELFDLVGELAVGAIIGTSYSPELETPGVQDFVEEMTNFMSYETACAMTAAIGYDGAMRMFMAIDEANSLDREAINAAMPTVYFDGAFSSGYFSEDGQIDYLIIQMELQADGTLIPAE
jgi:branched-chain amino acid transport system substrate-binding protein